MSQSDSKEPTPFFAAMSHEQATAYFTRRWERIRDDIKTFPTQEKLRLAADFIDRSNAEPKPNTWMLKLARQIAEHAAKELLESEVPNG